jgi:hypothetical protein
MNKLQYGKRVPGSDHASLSTADCFIFTNFFLLIGSGVILSFAGHVGAATTIFCVAIFLSILEKVSAIEAQTSNINDELQALQRAIYHLDCACEGQQSSEQAPFKEEVRASEGICHILLARHELKCLCEQVECTLAK